MTHEAIVVELSELLKESVVRCEIVAVGTELLLGQIVDTNSAWIAEQLALIGVDCHFQTRVGDNQARIEKALHLALGRADVVIVCGGLGPTPDDITRQAIAQVMGGALQRDVNLLARLEAIFRERGRPFSLEQSVQADVPDGALIMSSIPGTAPGLICPIGKQRIYAMPGVPSEMRVMLRNDVLPDLQRLNGTSVIASHQFYCWGPGESAIATLLAPRIAALEKSGNPTIAFLASDVTGIRVRITAKAATLHDVQALLAAEADEVRPLLGDCVFSESVDGEPPLSLEARVLELLAERGSTLALAESLTGGLIGARLTAVPGASHVFRGAVVAYASDVKFEQLEVPVGPVVSEAAAEHMARAARRLLHANVGLAATGVAGPEAQDGVPVGTVCVAIALEDEVTTRTLNLAGRPREQVRELTATWLLDMLRRRLQGLAS